MARHRWLLVLSLVAGCGNSHGSSGPSVADLCHETIDTWCIHNQECSVATGETTQAQGGGYVDTCRGTASVALDCSRKTQLAGDVDACQMDMQALPCSLYVRATGLPLPASCRDIFK